MSAEYDLYEAKKDALHWKYIAAYLASCHATAAQRADAFLRTVGKWENPE